jgi:hypothetical protein
VICCGSFTPSRNRSTGESYDIISSVEIVGGAGVEITFESRFSVQRSPDEPVDFTSWLLKDIEHQRQNLCETFFEMIDDHLGELDSFIEQEQSNPKELFKVCEGDHERVSWLLDMPSSAIKEHKEAFCRCIACLDLLVGDLHKLQSFEGSPDLLKSVLLTPADARAGWSRVFRLLSQAHQHLAAVRILNEKLRYSSGRERGARIKASKLVDKDYDILIDVLVKGLIQENPYSQQTHSQKEIALADLCYSEIMDLWKDRPIFHFDEQKVRQAVVESLVRRGKLAKRKKTTFERRRRPVSFHGRPHRRSRESVACREWQSGIASSLLEVLKTRFGVVSDEESDTINNQPPERLMRWLRHAVSESSVKEVLSKE